MKKWICALVLVLCQSALATQPLTSTPPDRLPLNFQVLSKCAGCLHFTNFKSTEKFYDSYVKTSLAKKVRLYYSPVSFEQVTPESAYMEFDIIIEDGSYYINKTKVRGLASGQPYFFKASVLDDQGNFLYFAATEDADITSHYVVTK